MRETKFRAWDKVNKKMCNVWDISWKAWDKENSINYVRVECGDGTYDLMENEVELIQYTGLKDKNGKEICEGDIINLGEKGYAKPFSIIFMDGSFRVKDDKIDLSTNCYPELSAYSNDVFIGCVEIIGNIYENPELLKKED